MPFNTNLLLEALPDDERSALQVHLRPSELSQQQILFDVGGTIDAVYFPTDAVVSLVVPLSKGEVV